MGAAPPRRGSREPRPFGRCPWSVQNKLLKDGEEQRLPLETVKWAPDRVRVLRGSVPASPTPWGPAGSLVRQRGDAELPGRLPSRGVLPAGPRAVAGASALAAEPWATALRGLSFSDVKCLNKPRCTFSVLVKWCLLFSRLRV